jgi:predicted RNA-binding Zn-ribbon protein involved in translation (DUF1610 family)
MSEAEEVIDPTETKLRAFNFPLCTSKLNEHQGGPATLFICPNCGVRIGKEELEFYGSVCERCYFFSGFNKQKGIGKRGET